MNRVKINGPHSMRVEEDVFKGIASGTIRQFTKVISCSIGDRVIFKEFNGHNFTGDEIIAQITEVLGDGFIFKVQSRTESKYKGRPSVQPNMRHL